MLEQANPVPLKGIIQLSDVTPYDSTAIPRIKTMIPALDETIGGLAEGAVTVFTGKPGDGKLLSDNTPVLTRKGWKKHGDLILGDEVVGLDGRFKKVTHIFPKGMADMKILFSNGEHILCHRNHEWVVEYHTGNSYKRRITTAQELYNAFESSEGYRIAKNGKCSYRFKLPLRSPLDTEDKVLAVPPYTLGAWLGDGRNRAPDICTAPHDTAIVQQILRDGYDIAWRTIHKKTGCHYTSFRRLRKDLQKLGFCHSRKTVEKYIPSSYLTASYAQRISLLAGLLDTDGYYDRVKGCYVYTTVDESLRESFKQLLSTFGWSFGERQQVAHTSSSGIVGKRDSYQISFAPKDHIPCVLPRKQVTHYTPQHRISIVGIEPCQPVQGNCISVEDGIYCVGHTMLPTHNSTLAGQ